MRMRKHIVHCFAERSQGVWVAYCVELGLGAQGDSFQAAKEKLEAQIADLSPEEGQMLLRQGSPLSLRARYWGVRSILWIAGLFGQRDERRIRFNEPVPHNFVAC